MFLSNLTIRVRLAILISVFAVGFTSFTFLAYKTLNRVKVNGPVYAQIIQTKDLVADVLPPPEYIVESYLNVLQLLDETNPRATATLIERGRLLRQQYEEGHDRWAKELPDGEIKRLLVHESYCAGHAVLRWRDQQFFPVVLANDKEKARNVLRHTLTPHYDAHRASIDKLVLVAKEMDKNNEQSAASLVEGRSTLMLLSGIAAISVGLLIAVLIAMSVSKVLCALLREVKRLADAAVEGQLQTRGNPELVSLEFRPILEGVNTTLDAVVGPLKTRPGR